MQRFPTISRLPSPLPPCNRDGNETKRWRQTFSRLIIRFQVEQRTTPYVLLKLWKALFCAGRKYWDTRPDLLIPSRRAECFQNLGPLRDESLAESVTAPSPPPLPLCHPWGAEFSGRSLSADLCRPYVKAHCNSRLEPSCILWSLNWLREMLSTTVRWS